MIYFFNYLRQKLTKREIKNIPRLLLTANKKVKKIKMYITKCLEKRPKRITFKIFTENYLTAYNKPAELITNVDHNFC